MEKLGQGFGGIEVHFSTLHGTGSLCWAGFPSTEARIRSQFHQIVDA